MKTLLVIILMFIVWFVSTQFGIAWPRINLVKTVQIEKPAPVLPTKPLAPGEILPKEEVVEETMSHIEQMEREVLSIVNGMRAEKGISVLEWDDRLHNLARMHSQEMAIKGKMFHSSVNKEYAENCWQGNPAWHEAADIVASWMNSERHRTWLLCPNIEHIGAGIYIKDGEMYASWKFWRYETKWMDWWYMDGTEPPDWWY